MTREGSGSFGGAAILYQSTSWAGTLNIDHSTITYNTSASVGGGISISLLGGSSHCEPKELHSCEQHGGTGRSRL